MREREGEAESLREGADLETSERVMDSLGIERNRRKEEQREAHLQSYQCTQRGKASLSEAVSNERLKEMRERL